MTAAVASLAPAALTTALLRDGHATGFGHVDVLLREGMLVDGLRDTPGPEVTGRIFDARRVQVRLVDKDRGDPQRVVEKRATVTGSTWNVSFRPGQLSRLGGRLRVASLHTLTGETARIRGAHQVRISKLR